MEDGVPNSCTIHTSQRLLSYEETGTDEQHPVTLSFEDGSKAQADLLFGADGIRSVVRRGMFGPLHECSTAKWTGCTANRFIARAEDVLRKAKEHNYESKVAKGAVFVSIPGAFIACAVNKIPIVLREIETCCRLSDQVARNRSVGIFVASLHPSIILHLRADLINVNGHVSVPDKMYPPIPALEDGNSSNNPIPGVGEMHPGRWVVDIEPSELQREYVGWEQELQDIMAVRVGSLLEYYERC